MIDPRIAELQESLVELNERAQALQAVADNESRLLTDEEQEELDSIFAEFETVEADIKRRERIAAQTTTLQKSLWKRPSEAAQGEDEQPEEVPFRQGVPTSQEKTGQIRIIAHPEERSGRGGFKHFGEFCQTVMRAGVKGGPVDPRLYFAAPTTYGQEGVGADGGYAVPPDFRQAIMQLVQSEESLLSRTMQIQTNSNNLSLPTDESTDWGSSGVQAYWEAEAAQLSQSKPALKKVNVTLNKLTALVGVTEELREDAAALNSLLPTLAAGRINNALNNAIVNGTGAGTPLGILQSNSLIAVAKESGQAADTVLYQNIISMWSRLYAPWRQNAVWLIHQDVEPQLQQMYLPTGSTGVAAYMPPGGLSGSPYATIMGRPVLPTQAAETVGDQGDVILWAPQLYLTAVKAGGIRSELSIHLWFDYDTAALRFILRVAGQPLLSAAISPRDGSNTLSSHVTLAERA